MDTLTAENPRAVIGGNAPPPTPFAIVLKKIEDLYDEAKLWMDGEPISSQEQADGIANLMAMIRAAEAEAEALRVAEKKPLDVQIAEIQSRFAPLIADTKSVKGKTVRAIEACKAALAPWLKKIADEKQAREDAARAVADEARRIAEQAIRSRDATNLAESEAAEQLVKDAKRAEQTANRIGRESVTSGGTVGRAIGLRTVWVATLTNFRDAAAHYYVTAKDEMTVFVQGLADKEVAAGKRMIPGFEIKDEKVL